MACNCNLPIVDVTANTSLPIFSLLLKPVFLNAFIYTSLLSSSRFQWRDQAKRWLSHCFTDIDNEVKALQTHIQTLIKNTQRYILQLIIVRNGKTKVTDQAKMIVISYELLTKMTSLHTGEDTHAPHTCEHTRTRMTSASLGIKVVVCDESHYLKSAQAKRSQIVRILRCYTPTWLVGF